MPLSTVSSIFPVIAFFATVSVRWFTYIMHIHNLDFPLLLEPSPVSRGFEHFQQGFEHPHPSITGNNIQFQFT